MSDQQPTPDLPVQDTPAPTDAPISEAPNPDGQVDTTNWQERYENLRPEFTRATQEAAEYRQLLGALQSEDPDTRAMAAQMLGLQLASQEQFTDDELDDPNAALRRELEDLKQWREQTTSAAQQQATEQRDVEHIGNGLNKLKETLGRDLTEQEVQLLGDAAWANRDQQTGLPNIDQVIELFTGIRTADQRSWAQGKQRAPFVSSSGQPASQAPNLDDPQEMLRWQTQRYMDLSADS